MPYATVTIVTRLLAQALTSSTPDTVDTLGDLMNIGNTLDHNNVSADVLNTYIADADADINHTLGMLYVTPFKMKADTEMTLLEDVESHGVDDSSSTDRTIYVSSPGVLVPGDILVITDGVNRETIEVYSVTGNRVGLVLSLSRSYSAASTRIVRIKYPDPIPYISSRIAAGNIYDKFFSAQADKNESTFGKYLRNLGRIKLQNIVQGLAVLNGQHRIGHLTVNPNLIKPYRYETEKEGYKLEDPGGR